MLDFCSAGHILDKCGRLLSQIQPHITHVYAHHIVPGVKMIGLPKEAYNQDNRNMHMFYIVNKQRLYSTLGW